jgi:prepilin peptidase CpaA
MIKSELITFYLAFILIVASISDIRSFRIPNWLTYSALAVGVSNFTLAKGYEGFLFSLAGAAAGFALLIGPYLFGGTGAGDVKLLGAIGSFLGLQGVFIVFLLSCVLGGAFALFLLASKGLLIATFKRYGAILKGFFLTRQFVYIPPNKNERQIKVRFGLAIALGTGSYLFWGSKLLVN